MAVLALAEGPLEVVEQTGRNEVVTGDLSWSTTITNGSRFVWIAGLVGMSGADRIREAARITARPGAQGGEATARRLLEQLSTAPIDRLCEASLSADAQTGSWFELAESSVPQIRADHSSSVVLADWRWRRPC